MDVDELRKDFDPAKLSNQVEDVKIVCNFGREFEVSDLETEFPRQQQILDENRQEFYRNMNAGETFMQENLFSANGPNQNYFRDSQDIFKSIGDVRFETAFMQNSLSRLCCEDDDDFRIDSHLSRGSQRNLKYTGASNSQTMTTTNRAAINMIVSGGGHINSIASEASCSPGEVISDTEKKEFNEGPVIQVVNAGVDDSVHLEEDCLGEVGYDHLTERGEDPSNVPRCERHEGVVYGFKTPLEAAYSLDHSELTSDIEFECQDQTQIITETADKTVFDDHAPYCKALNPDVGKEENIVALKVVFDQNNSDLGERIQIGFEINKKFEALLPLHSTTGARQLKECISSAERISVIDHQNTGESLIASDCESAVESKIGLESNSATESKSFCEGDGLKNCEPSHRLSCDNDLTGNQNEHETKIMVGFFNQVDEQLMNSGKVQIKTDTEHDTCNDLPIEVNTENMTEDRNEITYEISGDLENNLNATTENAVKPDANGSNDTEFYYRARHTFEADQIKEIEDDAKDKWKATIFSAPISVLNESVDVSRYQIEQDINLKSEDEAIAGSANEDANEEKDYTWNAVMADIVTNEDKSVIKVEHLTECVLDDKFEETVTDENEEKSDIADAGRVENYSSEFVNMNENKVNDRNECESKAEAESDGYNHNEDNVKETEHEYHLKTETCEDLDAKTRNEIVIQLQDEVKDRIDTAQLPFRDHHQTGMDDFQLQHNLENQMGEKLSLEDESKAEAFFENATEDSSQKMMSESFCENAKDIVDGECGTLSVKSISKTCEVEQMVVDENICQFENSVSVKDILGVNGYLELGSENECQRKDVFRQHEIQNDIVPKGGILNEVFQNGSSASKFDDTADCVTVPGLPDVLLSEGLLRNQPTTDISLAGTEITFIPCDLSQSDIVNDRSGFSISVDSCCGGIVEFMPTSTEHQMAVSQTSFEGNEKHLEGSYRFMPPIVTGETEIPDAFLEDNLNQHDVKDVHSDDQENSSTEIQEFYENNRSVLKNSSNLGFLLTSTTEKSCSDMINSLNFQANAVNCYDSATDVDFERPALFSDQFITFNDENSGLIQDLGQCNYEIDAVSYLDHGLESNTVNLTAKFDYSVPDLETNRGDSPSCNTNVPDLETIEGDSLGCKINVPDLETKEGDSNSCNTNVPHLETNEADSLGCKTNVPDLETIEGDSHECKINVPDLETKEGDSNGCYTNVPDLETIEGDSNSCNTFGDIPNQTDSVNLPELSLKSQKDSTAISANECISHFTGNRKDESSSCSSENFVLSHTVNSLLFHSNAVHSRNVDGAKPDEAFWPDVTLLKMETCFSGVSQKPSVAADKPLTRDEAMPLKNQGRVQQQPDSGQHLQHELHEGEVENLDVFPAPQLSTDWCSVYKESSMREFNAFGDVSDVRVADTSIAESDFVKQIMIQDHLKIMTQEVPSCFFTEHNGPQILTEKSSTTCISATAFSSLDPLPAKESSPCSDCVFEIPSDEQQVPSMERVKHGNQVRDVSCLLSHLEETLYDEPPAKRRCCDVGVGGDFDHDDDHNWCKDKQETNLGGHQISSLTGGVKERVPLYAWKNLSEQIFEDHSGITEESFPISRDTEAAVPLVILQLNKCQKPMRLGLSRRYRAPTQLHPNYKTPPD